MNFKLLFPTFRNRYQFVKARLNQWFPKQTQPGASVAGLNLGTGEGDYDRMLAAHCTTLVGCDVNQDDLNHAASLNHDVPNLRYELNNALALTYADNSFDLIVSCEVIEHVGDPARMVQEMSRVLRPGGMAIMTFPSREFPITYDPVNRIWQWLRKTDDKENLISQGAYAFGHDYLIGSADFQQWAQDAGFEIVEFRGLSRHLVGILEVYWTGIAQSIFKKNARNVTSDTAGSLKVRPSSTGDPALGIVTDLLLWLDQALFGWTSRSIGKGVVLRKRA
ncbi:MAG: methyltransferase domain-containing protein [Saprospiraceae bacterium]|nr:methyltransferase domain-containing protein [Saprospiraceae bacterium]